MSQRGPKNHKKTIRAEFLGVLEGSIKRISVQGFKKWDYAVIYDTWARSGVSKRDPVWGQFWGSVLPKNGKKGFQKIAKNQFKKHSKVDPKMKPFGGNFETRFKAIRNLGFLAPPWTALAPSWGSFGGHFCDFGCRFANIFCFLSCLSWAAKWFRSSLQYSNGVRGHKILWIRFAKSLCRVLHWYCNIL